MKAYERLLRYTNFAAASDSTSETCPSTPEQLDFGQALVEEMLELGIKMHIWMKTAMCSAP